MNTKSEAFKKQVQELDNIQKWNHNFILPGGIAQVFEKNLDQWS